tara:strand:+ start:169 stop:492 length:324 start_codon:yes stop_codon:yes gene_type:complete
MKTKFNILIALAGIVFLGSLLSAKPGNLAMYPKNFIPFWSQAKRGHEVALLNTAQIVQIRPYFNPTVDKPTHDDIQFLEVDLIDGKTLEVYEDFEKFYGRVRVSQAK